MLSLSPARALDLGFDGIRWNALIKQATPKREQSGR